MISIVICDDENNFLDELEEHIKNYANSKCEEIIITRFTSGEELLKNYKLGFDIIFLDISMAEVSGIEAAKYIRDIDKNVIIVFLTSIIKYALAGYTLGASNYILKPITFKKLSMELDKAIKKCKEMEHQYITLKNNDGIFKLYVREIMYIETSQRNTLIHTSGQDVVCFYRMKALEEKLESFGFLRCHSGFIINIRYVKSIEKLLITLTDDTEIPISQQKRKDAMKMIAIYLGDEL